MPILAWIKRLCDHAIHMLGGDNIEFVWRNDAVVDPTIQRENLVAYVGAGMITRRRAAEIMGETLPSDPMADVLTVTTGQGVVKLGGNSAQNSVGKRQSGITGEAATLGKYSPEQPRADDGRWTATGAGETEPKKLATNCDEEWEDARKMCDGLLNLPKFHPDRVLLGGHKTTDGCAKGFVSQRCGGNRVT